MRSTSAGWFSTNARNASDVISTTVQSPTRAHPGGARIAGEQRHLAEVRAAVEHGQLDVARVEAHAHAPRTHHERRVPRIALPDNRFAGAEHAQRRGCRQRLAILDREQPEQVGAGQQVLCRLDRRRVGSRRLQVGAVLDADRIRDLDALALEGVVDPGADAIGDHLVHREVLNPEPRAMQDRRGVEADDVHHRRRRLQHERLAVEHVEDHRLHGVRRVVVGGADLDLDARRARPAPSS